MPKVGKVVETCLYVTDVGKSAKFYQDVLGVEPFDPNVAEKSVNRVAAFNVSNQQVLLLFPLDQVFTDVNSPGGVIPKHGATGDIHVCFSIEANDLDDWKEHLASHLVALESEVKWPRGGTSLYVRDPDHHCIELATPGVWSVY